MLYSAVSQISTLSVRKTRKMICEIVLVSAPASTYSNGFVNDFSPIFIESLKTEEIICSFSVMLYCILWGKIYFKEIFLRNLVVFKGAGI